MKTDTHKMRGKYTESQRYSIPRNKKKGYRHHAGLMNKGDSFYERTSTAHYSAEYRSEQDLLGGLQFEVEHGADEVGELGISFGSTGNRIKRRLRVGLGAAGRGIG